MTRFGHTSYSAGTGEETVPDYQSDWGNNRPELARPPGRSRNLGFLACFLLAGAAGLGAAAYDSGLNAQWVRDALLGVGLLHRDHSFAALYQSYGMKPLRAADERASAMYDNLVRLEAERCDKQAVYAAASRLSELNEKRAAVDLLLGFAGRCFDSEGEVRIATDHLFELGDYRQAATQAHRLVGLRPEVADYSYRLARAEAGLGHVDEALQGYATTIRLSPDQHRIYGHVFFEMSAIYARQGRFCEAISPIQTYVSLDPARRDTAQTGELISTYAAKGSCGSYSQGGDSFAVLTNDVIPVRVTINGVPGTFALDTGASFVTVTKAFAQRAGVGSEHDGMVDTMTANGASSGRLATAASVAVGHAAAQAVPVLVQERGMGRLDGLLGRSFLSRFDLAIAGGRWTLKAKQSAQAVAQADAPSSASALQTGRSVAEGGGASHRRR